jgi:dTDP-4-amino-4,6-dideoxygalactose transaminase
MSHSKPTDPSVALVESSSNGSSSGLARAHAGAREMTPGKKIPLSLPHLSGIEQRYVVESMASGKLSGDGPFTKRVRTLLEQQLPAKHVLLTTSCTSALELAAILLKPKAGEPDEVIIPSFTFVSTVNAFLLHGFKPVFCDVRTDTGNVDASTIEPHIGPRTRAIVPVHYAGVPCDMKPILELAKKHRLYVVEDAAQAVYSRRDGWYAGTQADLGAFSFHDTKNFVCGEGGALVVNREELALRAEIVREKGTNRSQFLLGHVDKYTWVDVGGSFLPSDVLAAFLLGQLESRDVIMARRKHLWHRYQQRLQPLADRGLLRLPVIPDGVDPNYHLYFVVLQSFEARTSLMQALNAQGIAAAFHYPALHTTPMGKGLHPSGQRLPGAEELADRLLRLPLYVDLSDDEQDRVVDAVAAHLRSP